MDSIIFSLIIVIVVLFIIFLILRELNCWYWKINDIINILSRIEAKLPNEAVPAVSTLQASPNPIQGLEAKQKVKIECPHCHKSEEIRKNNYSEPSEYSIFKAKYNSFSGSVNIICNNCGTKFKMAYESFTA